MLVTIKNGKEPKIRDAVPEDAEQLLAYVEQVSGESSYLTFGPGEFTMTLEEEVTFLRACQDSPNQCYIVGFMEDKLVAVGNVGASPRPRLRHRSEFGMSVLRAYWGLGVGTAILNHLIAYARDNPMLTKLDLRVRADNSRAIALYRRSGFVEEGVLRKQISLEGKLYDLIAMGMEV